MVCFKLSNSAILCLVILLNISCVERIDKIGDNKDENNVVVDGFISDQPGPYTVRLSYTFNAEDNLFFPKPVTVNRIVISSSAGELEKLSEIAPGVYQTSQNGIRGEIGKKYSLLIELVDGTIFESTPDELLAGGTIEDLSYKFTTIEQQNGPAKNGFKVYVSAKKDQGVNAFFRWRFTGVYKFRTYPELHRIADSCPPNQFGADPLPCSSGPYGCTCCVCWVTNFEDKPHLSSREVQTDGTFKNIEIGYVPFDEFTFLLGKYMIKVEQMSLTDSAFDFFNRIKDQKEGSQSLFQPPYGVIKSNFTSTNPNRNITGIFYATSIESRVKFITSEDSPLSVPIPVIPFNESCFYWNACTKVFSNASITSPPEWK